MEIFSYDFIDGSEHGPYDRERSWKIRIFDDGLVIYESERKYFERKIRKNTTGRIRSACERCMEKIIESPETLYDGDDCDTSKFVLLGDFTISTVEDTNIWFTPDEVSEFIYIEKALGKLCSGIERDLYINGIFITFPFGITGNPIVKAEEDIIRFGLRLFAWIQKTKMRYGKKKMADARRGS